MNLYNEENMEAYDKLTLTAGPTAIIAGGMYRYI